MDERRGSSPLPSESPPAAALVDSQLRRFPWPANPDQRYGLDAPYLAVVNARGPWAVWKHPGGANPPFIPLCLDLLDKAFWRSADHGQRVFCITAWLNAAREDRWGIVWGDPVRLCLDWRLDPATFTARLDWMIGQGLACYLTRDEADAARSWRNHRSKIIDHRSEGEGGKPEGGGGEPGKGEEQDKQGKTRQGKQDKAEPVQVSGDSARTRQVSGSMEQGQDKASKQAKPSTAQQANAKAQHSTEPASLPQSDRRAGPERARPPRNAEGLKREGRPGSVSSDTVTVGELLAWGDPRAVAFGRRMYEAVHGRSAPPDLTAATNGDKSDVGVWVHFWFDRVRTAIEAGRYAAFEDRCVRDVAKKRRIKRIRDLGAVARAKIVPGILAAMGGK